MDVRFIAKGRLIPLAEMRTVPALAGMQVLRRGNRLSITAVTPQEWATVIALLQTPGPSALSRP